MHAVQGYIEKVRYPSFDHAVTKQVAEGVVGSQRYQRTVIAIMKVEQRLTIQSQADDCAPAIRPADAQLARAVARCR